ncbi:MAG: hypothetical protein ACLFQ3_04045 [Thiohalorhabdus sp.]
MLAAGGGDSEEARARLEEHLLAFQEAKPTVQGGRFLDLWGNSLVKVEQGQIVPSEETGDLGLPVVANHVHTGFFPDARFLGPGEVGVSNFELVSVSPDKDFCPAMVRFTTPLEYGGRGSRLFGGQVWGRYLDRMLGGMIVERKGNAFLAEYDRKRHGVGFHFYRQPYRLSGECIWGSGLVFDGATPTDGGNPTGGPGISDPNSNFGYLPQIAPDEDNEFDGWYLEGAYFPSPTSSASRPGSTG